MLIDVNGDTVYPPLNIPNCTQRLNFAINTLSSTALALDVDGASAAEEALENVKYVLEELEGLEERIQQSIYDAYECC